MNKVTIPKKEYDKLLETKVRYEYIKRAFSSRDDLFASPPTKNPSIVVNAFKKTGLYNKHFLASLEKGLKRSAFARS